MFHQWTVDLFRYRLKRGIQGIGLPETELVMGIVTFPTAEVAARPDVFCGIKSLLR